MQNVFVSLSRNVLKVSSIVGETFKNASVELAKEVCAGSQLIDVGACAQIVNPLIAEVTGQQSNKSVLNMIIDPEDMFLYFSSVNKRDGDIASQITADISHKLEGVTLDELYYSYEKIAPFVYQFAGIRKALLDSYLELSNKLGVGLQGVFPWIFMLPKFQKICEPSIFLNRLNGEPTVALSEFGGVFYAGLLDQEKSSPDLQKMVQALSIYKRATPITNVYTLGYDSFSLGDNYRVQQVELPGVALENAKGFEHHLLIANCLATIPDMFDLQANMVKLFPLPAVEKKPALAVYAGVTAALIVLVGGSFFVVRNYMRADSGGSSQGAVPSDVLSQTSESSQSTTSVAVSALQKADLKIRVENGSGVSGIASKTRDFLQTQEYVVASIGDAEVVGRQNTLLRFKQSKVVYKDMLTESMKSKYLDIVVQDDLPDSTAYDLLIIVGTNVSGL